jgi:hypothetical protein
MNSRRRVLPASVASSVSHTPTGVSHPLGMSSSYPSKLDTSSIVSFMESSLAVASLFLWDSILDSTKTSYQSGWRHFQTFVVHFGTNVTLSTIPECWPEFAARYPLFQFEVAVILSFMAYLRFNIGVTPSTVCTYLSAVRFMLGNSHVDSSFMDTAPAIKNARQGMYNNWRMVTGITAADRVRLPFTIDQIMFAHSDIINVADSFRHICCFTALCAGFILCARKSELFPTSKCDHHLRGCDVSFTVLYHDKELSVVSSDVHLYPQSSLLSVEITIRSAKNDVAGQGFRFTFPCRHVLDPDDAFDFCSVMYLWSILGRPAPLDPFFSTRRDPIGGKKASWKMSPEYVVGVMRKASSHFSLDPKRFSMHSLRIGGASAMAAAGIPHYVIQKTGRWKSLAFLNYIRLSSNAFESAQRALSSSTIFTSAHVKLWNSGCQVVY